MTTNKESKVAGFKNETLATIGEVVGFEKVAEFEKQLDNLEKEVRKEMKGSKEEEVTEELRTRMVRLSGETLRELLDEANLLHRHFDPTNWRYWTDKIVTGAVTTLVAGGITAIGLKVFAPKVEGQELDNNEAGAPAEGNLFSHATERPMRGREQKSA